MPDGYRLLWAGWYRLEDGAGPYAWDGASDFDLIGSGRGAEAAAGGAALLVDETNGFATDFTHAVDAERVAIKTAGTVVPLGLDAHYQNASTSSKQIFDVSGNLVWSPHNLLQRSEDFTQAIWIKTGTPVVTAHSIQDDDAASQERADQTPAGGLIVVGQNYTISLWVLKDAVTTRFPCFAVSGTGSLFLSFNTSTGVTAVISNTYVSVSNLVEDLGTHWKVKITFVAENATTSLRIYPAYTLTLGGVASNAAVGSITIDKVQWNRGAVPTEYLTTTTAARYGLAVDYDSVTHASKGLLCEPAATNLLLNSTTLSTQSVTVTAVAHTLSFWGTGTITLTGTSTAGPLVGTGASNRVSLTFTPTAGSLTCTVSGTVTRGQLEIGTVATSPIPTFAATATRAMDNYSATISPALGAEYSMYGRMAPPPLANTRILIANDGTGNDHMAFSSGATMSFAVRDGNVSQAAIVQGAITPGVPVSCAGRVKLNDFAFSMSGATPTFDTAGTVPTVTLLQFGNNGTGGTLSVQYVEKLAIVPRAWSDAELQTRSAS